MPNSNAQHAVLLLLRFPSQIESARSQELLAAVSVVATLLTPDNCARGSQPHARPARGRPRPLPPAWLFLPSSRRSEKVVWREGKGTSTVIAVPRSLIIVISRWAGAHSEQP